MEGASSSHTREASLGWLTESTTLPKKRKAIEGVSGRGVVDLQAQLYKAQEHSRLRRDGQIDVSDRHIRRHAGIDVAEIHSRSNPGVAERDQRDRLHIKSAGDRTSECYAALERKAKLYDKLSRGEVDDDDEQYEVDFLRKGPAAGSQPDRRRDEPIDTAGDAIAGSGAVMSADMHMERERRSWEAEAKQLLQA